MKATSALAPAVRPDTWMPLSRDQQGLMPMDESAPDAAQWDISQRVEIRGELDIDAFHQAVRYVVRNNDALRTRLSEVDGRMGQVVEPDAFRPVRVVDLTGVDNAAQAAEAAMRADMELPLNVTAPCMYSFILFKLPGPTYWWYLRSSHVALDGLGAWLAMREAARVYDEILATGTVGADRSHSVRTLLESEERYLAAPAFTKDRAYWASLLAVPRGFVRMTEQPPQPAMLPLREMSEMPPSVSAELAAVARSIGTGWQTAALAAIAALISQWTGRPDPACYFITNSRGPGTLEIPGSASNALALPLLVAAGTTWRDLVRDTSPRLRSALRHRRYPIFQMTHDMTPQWRRYGKGVGGPIVNIMSMPEVSFGGQPVAVTPLGLGLVPDVRFNVWRVEGQGTLVTTDANPALYDADTVRALHHRLLDLLDAFRTAPDQPVPLPA